MRAVLAALLLLAAPASAQHLYTGTVQPRTPTCFEQATRVWFHVINSDANWQPVKLAIDPATLTNGGGDRLDPGSAADVLAQKVCVVAPINAGLPRVSIEVRLQASQLHVDPLGQLRAVGASKVYLYDLTPGTWRNLASNISGLIAWEVKAEGGRVWIGTHLNTTQPPWSPQGTTGLAWPLDDGETLRDIGNPAGLYAWTDQPGVRVRLRKTERGFNW